MHVVRQAAGEQFVKDDAERVDVAARVDRLPQKLLGTHVGPRAHELARLRDRVVRGEVVSDPGDSEIDHLRPPILVDEDVAGLQVTMHDAVVVAVGDRVADHSQQLQPCAGIEAVTGGVLDERFGSGNELHHDVRRVAAGVTVHAGAVDVRDAGMTESAEHLSLAAKAERRRAGAVRAGPHHFHRHGSREAALAGLVHAPHASLPDEPLELRVAEFPTDQRIDLGIGPVQAEVRRGPRQPDLRWRGVRRVHRRDIAVAPRPDPLRIGVIGESVIGHARRSGEPRQGKAPPRVTANNSRSRRSPRAPLFRARADRRRRETRRRRENPSGGRRRARRTGPACPRPPPGTR